MHGRPCGERELLNEAGKKVRPRQIALSDLYRPDRRAAPDPEEPFAFGIMDGRYQRLSRH